VTEEEASQKDWNMDFSLRPEGKLVMAFKFIYKIKRVADGSKEMYKTLFVEKNRGRHM
jgi:hypothetical protein